MLVYVVDAADRILFYVCLHILPKVVTFADAVFVAI